MAKRKSFFGLLFIILCWGNDLTAQTAREKWVDSVFQTMSMADKVGQLFMVSLSGEESDARLKELENRIKSDGIGGVVFTKNKSGNPAEVINRFQALASIPLIVAVDGNPVAHLPDSLLQYPSPPALG